MTRRDPATAGVLLFAAMMISGFVAIAVAWKVAARTLVVAYQVPALVSGALGGLALVIAGGGLLAAQLSRRWAAQEQAQTEALARSLSALADAVRESR